ncbi:MAG: DNA-binding MarR family transcriptional regulator [Halioglobus sp.]|jgi:DNA-binding MarR family transcriptional regulator
MAECKEDELVLAVINLHGKIHKRAGGTLSIHGIGLTEYLVLHQLVLATNQTMRRVDLAEQVGLSPSGITRLLNPMEKIGLIEKELNPRDARVSLVALSVAGKRIYEEAKVSFGHTSKSLFEPLDSKQLGTLFELVKVVAR